MPERGEIALKTRIWQVFSYLNSFIYLKNSKYIGLNIFTGQTYC